MSGVWVQRHNNQTTSPEPKQWGFGETKGIRRGRGRWHSLSKGARKVLKLSPGPAAGLGLQVHTASQTLSGWGTGVWETGGVRLNLGGSAGWQKVN